MFVRVGAPHAPPKITFGFKVVYDVNDDDENEDDDDDDNDDADADDYDYDDVLLGATPHVRAGGRAGGRVVGRAARSAREAPARPAKPRFQQLHNRFEKTDRLASLITVRNHMKAKTK
jgi:hypothetical protein